MPNWCMNKLELTGPRERMWELIEAYRGCRFLEAVVPIPEPLKDQRTSSFGGPDAETKDGLRAKRKAELGYESWYDYCIDNWGTKWDVGGRDASIRVEDLGDQLRMHAAFDSAWNPPIQVYDRLVEDGLQVKAYYWEPGCAFAGRYVDGDECYSVHSSNDCEDLPYGIVEAFDMVEQMNEWEEE